MPRVTHFDMVADDVDRARKFYAQVFGWRFQKWDGPTDYWLITTGEAPEPGIDGGLSQRSPTNPAGANTIGVMSLEQTLAAVTTNGGKVMSPKNAIPGVGWFAMCADTEGNAIGVIQLDETAK